METVNKYFGIWDYIVFGAVLFVSASIGIYYRFSGGKQKTFKEYLLANQEMSIVPVAFSLMASFMSAITILGVSKENYVFGTQFIMINISYILATPIVCYLFLPVFFRLQKISVYEYLELRFGKQIRLLASVAFSLQMTLYMGIVLYAPSLALSAVTGISQNWSMVTVGLVCTFYSAIGGMKAVLITDVFQSLLMFGAVYAVIIKGIYDFGFGNILHYASEGERLELFNLSVDPRVRHTVWSLGIGGVFTYCSLYGVNQAQVQRLLTVRSLRKAQNSLWLQWIILMCLSLSTSFCGLVMYAQYRNCDPWSSNKISNADQLLPYYVVDQLGNIPGVSGLFVSGIFSGSLSTVSSAVNSLSAVTLQDYIMPFYPSSLTEREEKKAATLGKVIAAIYGIICMGIAFMSQYVTTGVLQAALTIFGAVGGPLLAVFTMGMSCRMINQKGALCGLAVGLLLTLWVGFGEPKSPPPRKPLSVDGCFRANATIIEPIFPMENSTLIPFSDENKTFHISNKTDDTLDSYNPLTELYALSYMWVAAFGFLTTFLIGWIVSFTTKDDRNNGTSIDKNLLFSFLWTTSDASLIFNEREVKVSMDKSDKEEETHL